MKLFICLHDYAGDLEKSYLCQLAKAQEEATERFNKTFEGITMPPYGFKVREGQPREKVGRS